MKLFVLLVVAWLAGCSGAAPGSRSLDLTIPPPELVVITTTDYPGFTLASSDAMTPNSFPKAIDGRIVTIYSGGGGEDRVEIRSAAFRFESNEAAHAGFEQIARGVGENATHPAWGDEALRTKEGSDQAFFRDRSVLFAASLTHAMPTNITLDDIAATLLAKMPPRP